MQSLAWIYSGHTGAETNKPIRAMGDECNGPRSQVHFPFFFYFEVLRPSFAVKMMVKAEVDGEVLLTVDEVIINKWEDAVAALCPFFALLFFFLPSFVMDLYFAYSLCAPPLLLLL